MTSGPPTDSVPRDALTRPSIVPSAPPSLSKKKSKWHPSPGKKRVQGHPPTAYPGMLRPILPSSNPPRHPCRKSSHNGSLHPMERDSQIPRCQRS
ncbi:uncharacterized protein LOC120621491 [Pteropus medius]|uniref:uncharacterized protein LOC120621491 n=1 Tax=Pteropus vampyrus TaxID=132908 RepID=UPI00196AEE3E|nr:uncharacterized protein LOC120621491 [Pteropus giganteus]